MDFFALLSAGLFVAFLVLLYSHLKKRSPDSVDTQLLHDLRRELQDSNRTHRVEMTQRLDTIHDKLMNNLTSNSDTLQKHFKHTSGIITDVTEKLTKLDETNKQVLNFSEQLQSLEHILKNPKQRGILGEYWLETLLSQVLAPGQYKMQYDLGVDENSKQKLIPDAVIFIKDMIVPIDAKFSLENYNRISKETNPEVCAKLEKEFKSDVKKRIDETSKYIQPGKGTTNFAFMFVPAEGVYHNLITAQVGSVQINTRNLIEYAFEKQVMIVSPTSFFAYLQTVILGLKALSIEDSVKEIQKHAELLMRHLRAYEDHHNRVGKHLQTTANAYKASSKELGKIDKDIYRITDGVAGKELKPEDIADINIEIE